MNSKNNNNYFKKRKNNRIIYIKKAKESHKRLKLILSLVYLLFIFYVRIDQKLFEQKFPYQEIFIPIFLILLLLHFF